ncbi:collagen-like protein [Paenibacillus sp. OV219]|uniref:collagen-like protein n=1 Tax=Paenibacillus sp. OV219 TaxID=1884377 RepID=UPI0008BD398A|nr:collagen-like protein [Paenibacillus sp. OV219]SEO80344.1 Collagen triple helix repeat-containing protein [Paenibacillus sp. OV219]
MYVRKGTILILIGIVALFFSGLGADAATSSSDTNTIYACQVKEVGLIRIVDATTVCNSKLETNISWNTLGPKGFKGDPGTRSMGPAGSPGPAGAAGKNGAIGPQGPKGEVGDKGDPGVQGPAGANGTDGQDGAAGADGPQGPKGEMGDAGQQGPQGVKPLEWEALQSSTADLVAEVNNLLAQISAISTP